MNNKPYPMTNDLYHSCNTFFWVTSVDRENNIAHGRIFYPVATHEYHIDLFHLYNDWDIVCNLEANNDITYERLITIRNKYGIQAWNK